MPEIWLLLIHATSVHPRFLYIVCFAEVVAAIFFHCDDLYQDIIKDIFFVNFMNLSRWKEF